MVSKAHDQAQRKRALDPAGSFIVQAPAGSGKTELLIRRFLVLLGRVEVPEQIVAITFTRKAAVEMRNRVIQALQTAREKRPDDPVEAELWQLAQAATGRDQSKAWQLASHPSRLQIQTIDALCLGLVRRMPWMSRCGAPTAIMDDASDLYRQAALETIQLLGDDEPDWAQAVERLLVHLDNQVTTAVSLLTDMLAHRDQWLRKRYMTQPALASVQRAALESAWRKIAVRHVDQALRALRVHDSVALVRCLNHACRTLSEEHAKHALSVWGERDALPAKDQLPAWQALAQALLTKDGQLRSRIDKRHGFPASDRELKIQMESLLASFAKDAVLVSALAQLQDLPAPEFGEEQWQMLAAINVLLPLAAARLRVLFGDRGVADFTEINLRANIALGGDDAPTDLALKLDYRIQHLLVDEFQDTSYTQFEFLKLLTAGWQPGDGRTLFLVGDPKQSIYRFREAEVGLFQLATDQGVGDVVLTALELTDNFRSDPALVDWINKVLPHAFPTTSDAQLGAIPYSTLRAVRQAGANAGAFFHPLEQMSAADEGSRVVELIKACRDRHPNAKIAVLVRARTHLVRLLPALQCAGIPYAGVDTQALISRPAVQDVMALTRALLQLADRIAWLSVLRAPWCGLKLHDLHVLASDGKACVWERMNDDAVIHRLSGDGSRRLKRIKPVLSRALAQRGRRDWRSVVGDAWIGLGGPVMIGSSDVADVETFLRLLGQHELDDLALAQLDQWLAKQWAAPDTDEGNAVQVMTMHKAKGLQFDIVILPGLHKSIRAGDDPLLRWEEVPEFGLLLAPRKAKGGEDEHYRFLSKLHKQKDQFENGRLIYVACTRAVCELHLLAEIARDEHGDVKTPRHGLLAYLWPGIAQHLTLPELPVQADLESGRMHPQQGEPEPLLRRLPLAWQAPDWREFDLLQTREIALGGDEAEPIEFSWAGESARHAGVLVHEFLQVIAEQGLGTWNRTRLEGLRLYWQQELAARGLVQEQLLAALQRVEDALHKVLEDKRAHWLFDPMHRERRSEYAVSTWRRGRVQTLKMDLTFIDADDQRWIVDYKTSAHEGGDIQQFLDQELARYRKQLHGYATVMAKLDPRPIQLALYFPLLQGWREWRHDPSESL